MKRKTFRGAVGFLAIVNLSLLTGSVLIGILAFVNRLPMKSCSVKSMILRKSSWRNICLQNGHAAHWTLWHILNAT